MRVVVADDAEAIATLDPSKQVLDTRVADHTIQSDDSSAVEHVLKRKLLHLGSHNLSLGQQRGLAGDEHWSCG